MVQPEFTPVEIVGYEVDEAGSPLALMGSSQNEKIIKTQSKSQRPQKLHRKERILR